jgi:hypothetical protein
MVFVALFLLLVCEIHLIYVLSFNVFGALVCYPEFSEAR